MPSLRTRLLNLLTGFSLVLCVATGVLWVRSYWHYSELEWGKSCGTVFRRPLYDHSIASSGGVVYYVRTYPPIFDAGWNVRWPAWHRCLGFLFVRGPHGLVPDSGATANRMTVGVPFWFIAGAMAALPIGRLARRVRRRPVGECRRCGYDLRATPDRCPECGAIAAAGAVP